MNNAPIGIIDSGSGGLSIYRSMKAMLPDESVLYIGDHANIPYGNKSVYFIRERVLTILGYLIQQKVKLVVIACNTATVAGIEYYRKKYPDIPIIGIVPVVKTAASLSKMKRFVILSTDFTAKSGYQKNLITSFASDCEVISIGSTNLVPFIEKGNLHSKEIREELQSMFQKMAKKSFDVIVLGCSHYPFVRDVIGVIVGSGVTILDSGDAVARQVKRILEHINSLSTGTHHTETFMTTGDSKNVTSLFRQLLAKNVEVSHVEL